MAWHGCYSLRLILKIVVFIKAVQLLRRYLRTSPSVTEIQVNEGLGEVINKWGNFDILSERNVSFLLSPSSCTDSSYSMILMVSSGPKNQELRLKWRQKMTGKQKFRLIFVMSQTNSDEDQKKVEEEHEKHGDLLQCGMMDGHRRLGYKLLMGYAWVYSHCRNVEFVGKSDDNVELDLETVDEALQKIPAPRKDIITCPTLNWGMKVLRSATPHMTGNWSVSKQEFERDVMPDFCIGFLYITTPTVGAALIQVGQKLFSETETEQIEDSLITGVLRERLPWVRIEMLMTPGVPSVWQKFFTLCPWMNTFKQTFFNSMIRSKKSSRSYVEYVGPVTSLGVWRFFVCLHIEGLLELVESSASSLVPSWLWDICVR